jgi:hypothetical protein
MPSFIKAEKPSQDKLDAVKAEVREVRDLIIDKQNTEERLSEINKSISDKIRNSLPTLFQDTGIAGLTLEPTGNLPAYSAKLDTEVKAGITREFTPEQRQDAMDWLVENGAEDLIKSVITITLDREDYGKAIAIVKEFRAKGLDVDLDLTVHWATLSSWLRERFEAQDLPPNIAVIGGTISPIVRLTAKRAK